MLSCKKFQKKEKVFFEKNIVAIYRVLVELLNSFES